jgi:arsenite/tail-anchored protein-transporting ATPase
MSRLREATEGRTFTFVVGKGGVGKTTAAGALALELADAGVATHLISTDPAHSLTDLFNGSPDLCSPGLTAEEFDAAAYAGDWIAHAVEPVTEIVRLGTYLDDEDVAGFARLALPGIDEVMAVLRLVELARTDGRVVVDTAPTGHTLRFLDAAATHESIARALQAMADKAAAVAGSMARREVRLTGESIIRELDAYAAEFRTRVLDQAAFVVAARSGDVVLAETRRLVTALHTRRLHVAATVYAGPVAGRIPDGGLCLEVPLLDSAAGCAGLRRWRDALAPCSVDTPGRTGPEPAGPEHSATSAGQRAPPAHDGDRVSALDVIAPAGRRLVLFAGKGGVGKTTCAAAAAVQLSTVRPVLLCSTDPAGSLDDVLGAGPAVPGLRRLQVDAEAEFRRVRERYREEVLAALERIGLSGAAALDRRVIDALFELAPPGIDEFAALAALLNAAGDDELVIIDAAPTGHFLRLLTMPDMALDWTRQLMRIIVKYRAAGAAGHAAESLLQTARELRALQQELRDPDRTAVVIVTLDEPMVTAESHRLGAALQEAGVGVVATLMNRVPVGTRPGGGTLSAPLADPPPVGASALREFVRAWKIDA